MYVCLNNFRKDKKNNKIISRKRDSVIKDGEEVRAKLTNNELKKLDFAAKNKSGTRLRMIEKNFENKELPLGIFLTRMKTKITNAFANNISIYI